MGEDAAVVQRLVAQMQSLGKVFAEQMTALQTLILKPPSPYGPVDPALVERRLNIIVWKFPALTSVEFRHHRDSNMVYDVPIVQAPNLTSYRISDTLCLDTIVESCKHSPKLSTLSVGVWKNDEGGSDYSSDDDEAPSADDENDAKSSQSVEDLSLQTLMGIARSGGLPLLKTVDWGKWKAFDLCKGEIDPGT